MTPKIFNDLLTYFFSNSRLKMVIFPKSATSFKVDLSICLDGMRKSKNLDLDSQSLGRGRKNGQSE